MARSAALASSSSRIAVEFPTLLHQPAITARIARPKSQDRDRGALRDRLAHARQRLRPDERRVGEKTSTSSGNLAIAALAASTACAVPRRSACTNISAPGQARSTSVATGAGVRPDHHRDRDAAGRAQHAEHMRQQRAARDLMQDLRPRGAHAGALAGREHDCKAVLSPWARPSCDLGSSYPGRLLRKSRRVAKFTVRRTKSAGFC